MNGQVGKQRFEKHLRIGVRFDGTRFVLQNGSPLPALAKDSVAELVLVPDCIQDENVRASFTGEKSVLLLKEGSFVMVGVSPTMIESPSPEGLLLASNIPIISTYLFVEVRLGADLWLQVRGDQEARLSPCLCTIPALRQEAESLNHAFTLISGAYETKRLSHSGNVFERAHTHVGSGKWKSLDELRLDAIQRMLSGATDKPVDAG